MTAGQLGLELHALRREDGIQRASDHASYEFKHRAYTFLCAYARRNTGPFIPEDVSDLYAASSNPQPHEKRAWAALWRRAVDDRVVRRIDAEGWSRIRCSPTYRYVSLVAA